MSRDRQAKPRTAEPPGHRGIRLLERLEQGCQFTALDPDPGIRDFEADHGIGCIAADTCDADDDAAIGGELDRITDQVREDLPQPDRISFDADRDGGGNIVRDKYAFGGCGLGIELDGFGDKVMEVERVNVELEFPGLYPRDIKYVVNHAEKCLAGPPNGVQISLLVRRQRRLGKKIGHAENAVHRRPDFMTHIRQKSRLGPVGGLGVVPRFLQIAFMLLLIGDVRKNHPDRHGKAFACGNGEFGLKKQPGSAGGVPHFDDPFDRFLKVADPPVFSLASLLIFVGNVIVSDVAGNVVRGHVEKRLIAAIDH